MMRPSLKFFCLLHVNKQQKICKEFGFCKIFLLKAILFIESEARLRFGLTARYIIAASSGMRFVDMGGGG